MSLSEKIRKQISAKSQGSTVEIGGPWSFKHGTVSVNFLKLVLPIVLIPLNHQAYTNMQRK